MLDGLRTKNDSRQQDTQQENKMLTETVVQTLHMRDQKKVCLMVREKGRQQW